MTDRGRGRRPNLPVSLSLIFPGWGQLYAGSYLKGAAIQITFIGSLFYVFILRKDMLSAGLVVPAVIWAYAVLDAWLAGRNRS